MSREEGVSEAVLAKCRRINSGEDWFSFSSGTDIPPEVSFKAAIFYATLHEREAQRKRDQEIANAEAETHDAKPCDSYHEGAYDASKKIAAIIERGEAV